MWKQCFSLSPLHLIIILIYLKPTLCGDKDQHPLFNNDQITFYNSTYEYKITNENETNNDLSEGPKTEQKIFSLLEQLKGVIFDDLGHIDYIDKKSLAIDLHFFSGKQAVTGDSHQPKIVSPITSEVLSQEIHSHNDRSSDQSSKSLPSPHQEQSFKVRRDPDGKLNVVFNDFLFLQSPVAASNKTYINPDFVYPNESYTKFTQTDVSDEPICSEMDTTKTFCTKVRNYPNLTKLEALLKRDYDKYEIFFGSDVMEVNVSTRMEGDLAEESLCQSTEKIIYPEAGTTRDNTKMFIVNADAFKQGIRIEECVNEHAPCKYMDSAPIGYKYSCKQHYIYRPLVAYTKGGELVRDAFKFPSCCMCMVRLEARLPSL